VKYTYVMARVVILSRTSKWGLDTDAKLVEQVFREAHALKWIPVASIDHMDSYQFTNPKPVDIQIHLEVPCRQAWSWAKLNLVVVNPEWWSNHAWNWALEAADLLIFKSPSVQELFPEVNPKKCVVIPWRTNLSQATSSVLKKNKVLYLVGDSKHKLAAAKKIVEAWKSTWPMLEVWGSEEVIRNLPTQENVIMSSNYRSAEERIQAQREAKYHCVASLAEGFGYTMAECAAVGSLPLWVGLPVQEYLWGNILDTTGRIAPLSHESIDATASKYREQPVQILKKAIQDAGDALFSLHEDKYAELTSRLQTRALELQKQFREEWKRTLKQLPSLKKISQPFVPRRIPKQELPQVAVVTITRNRPKWWANMTRNILLSDYPTDKLLWVVVDDGDGMGRIDSQVQAFREKMPAVQIEYVSLSKQMTIGTKRNRGCKAAIARNPAIEVFVMMDDDDHYPKSSIEARVTYLRDLKKGCVYCSTLPMYDCQRYISAMNVPPMDLSPAERVSEATLAFTRQFWETKGFPADSNMAEGELFVTGRDSETAEIPPDGIIVSFLHGGNSTSRRVPERQEPNGCHYGFDDDFFTYLSERGMD
jgi:hypothetical protein